MSRTFEHGSAWIRADFHLHTKADKEFDYKENDFLDKYIERLKNEQIQVGAITNHNKFDVEEFKNLRKKALKEDIFLLAGAELSVNDAASGIHCLIIFDYETWYVGGENYIEDHFLKSAFEGIANRYHENTSCNYSLKEVLQKLDLHRKKGRDSFVIMAHVEQKSGFLKEMGGGRIENFAKNALFKELVLGFQKVRTFDLMQKLNVWFENAVPAFVEGSDCKNLEEVGKAKIQKDVERKSFIKVGEFSFEATKYALIHSKTRLKNEKSISKKPFLRSATFQTGKKEKKVFFNSGLNTLIGIRGSGKSSLFETLRFGLGIDLNDQENKDDWRYKTDIVQNMLGNGKVTLEIFNEIENKNYFIQRKSDGNWQILDSQQKAIPNLPINSLFEVIYFGQKDLADVGKNFNKNLIETLLEKKLKSTKEDIAKTEFNLKKAVGDVKNLKKFLEQKANVEANIATLKENIKKFEEYNLESKLNKQLGFDQDFHQIQSMLAFENEVLDNFKQLLDASLDQFSQYNAYESAENMEFFRDEVSERFGNFENNIRRIKKLIDSSRQDFEDFVLAKDDFEQKMQHLQAEFDQLKVEISIPFLNIEDYRKFKNSLENEKIKLKDYEKKAVELQKIQHLFESSLQGIVNLWKQEFDLINKETQTLNAQNLSIKIHLDYQGDKTTFLETLKNCFRGSNLIENLHLKKIIENYQNFIEIYNDLYKSDSDLHQILSGGNLLASFQYKFNEAMGNLLTFRIPDKYILEYKGKELQKHSLGQRATALISFVLMNQNKHLVMIDQPEDDLDNQTIFRDLIQEINHLKSETQFILVTHNPNIPVLGDSEQVVVCNFFEEQISFENGSIDKKSIQQKIVDVMEGGKEAFDKRNNIYGIWKP